jgi:hypothetical protein
MQSTEVELVFLVCGLTSAITRPPRSVIPLRTCYRRLRVDRVVR